MISAHPCFFVNVKYNSKAVPNGILLYEYHSLSIKKQCHHNYSYNNKYRICKRCEISQSEGEV